MKKPYLVVFFTYTYSQDFLVVDAESPRLASEIVISLSNVSAIISVWEKAE